MQYYYECLEVYEKLVPEVKKHCKLLRKLDAKFLVVRDRYFEALSEFEDKKEEMTPSIRQYSKQVIEKGQETLNRISQEKWKTANSLMITIEYYLSRINGYVREFKCEIDSDNTPGTSIEIEKKFLEANRKRVKEIQEIRDEYPFLDDIFKIPEPELESTESAINESMVEPIKINGHRQQNIAVLLQDIGSSFRDDPPGIRSSSNSNSNKKNSFKIKTERRGSINGGAGTPSPRAMSPRLPKTPRFPNNNDSTMLTLPEPSPSSNSVSPMEVSPGPHGNLSFSYSENNILQNSFSTMPSFSGSQESRHGRQRKFTQKVQQMFKENKLGPGRPSNHHFPSTTFSTSTGAPELINSTNQIPQFNSSSSNNTQTSIPQQQQQIRPETPHPIASSSYSFPQDFSRLPQPTSQQQQYTFSPMYINSHPQIPGSTPQMPLQQQQNATFLSHQQSPPQQQQSPFYRPGQQVRLTMPNGNNIDGDGNEEDEDDREWCFCGEHSYGEMIACENQNCPYKWFHYQCVGINKPPTGKWFCAECQKTLGIVRN
jgi:hypothetical protein